MAKQKKKIGQMLVDAGLLKPDQLEQQIAACAASGMRLGESLCSKGLIREDQLVDLLSHQLGVARYDPERYAIDMAMASSITSTDTG